MGEKPIKCLAVKSKGGQLEDWEYTPEPLKPGDVDVRVLFNGLCHSDLHVWRGDWGPCPYPMVPGHEVVGVVEQVGSSVNHLKKGDHVGVGWFRDACLECDACVKGDDNVCPNGVPTIMGGQKGGFAERIRANAALAQVIPPEIDPAEAAPLLCAGVTVWSPISRYATRPGMKVGVVGLGGLGHLALQFASAIGADVYAISGTASKEKEARGFGAKHFQKISDVPDKTLDVILNTTPGGIKSNDLVQKLTYNGQLVYLGGGTDKVDVLAFDLILAQRSISGSATGGRALFREMFRIAGLHNVRPLIEKIPLSKANEAVEKLTKGNVRYRIVLETGDYFKSK